MPNKSTVALKQPLSLHRKHQRQFWPLIPALLAKIVCVGLDTYTNILVMNLLNSALNGTVAAVKEQFVFLLGIALIGVPFNLIAIYFAANYYRKSCFGLRKLFLERLLKLDLFSFNQRGSNTYYSQLTNDINTLEKNDIEAKFVVVTNFIQAFVTLLVLAVINLKILLLFLAVSSLFILFTQYLGRFTQKHQRERSEQFKGYTAYTREIISAFRLVKSNNLEEQTQSDFHQRSQEIQQKGYVIDRISTYIDSATNQLTLLVLFCFIYLAIYLAHIGLVTPGYIILLINSIANIMQPLAATFGSIPLIKGVRSIWSKMDDSLLSQLPAKPETVTYAGLQELIQFQDLSFAYEEKLILDKLNLRLEKGKKYLLIGPSGGGKSTILRLLRKYLSPQSGHIFVDQNDLSSLITATYLSHLSNVEQHVFLFEDSLRNNLTLYKSYSDAEIQSAVQRSGLSAFVAKQPLGLEQPLLDNGKNISGGEKARLAIARALLQQTELILLDEPFASLDDKVAQEIESELLNLEGLTLVQVSHVVFPANQGKYDAVYSIIGGKAHLCS